MHAVVRGFAAAAVPGLVSAGITRVLMRAIALVTDIGTKFTPGGLVIIAAVYTAALLPGCVALAASRGRWPWVLFGGGVAFLGYAAIVIGVQETEGAQDLTPARWVMLALLLLAMLLIYAAQAVVAARWARRAPDLANAAGSGHG